LVLLSIYNLHGQEVRTLINGHRNAGFHSVNWDGKDERGQIVPSGVYLYKLRVNGFGQTRKMIFMK
jgi:flagellar hook assembly protein FlgD